MTTKETLESRKADISDDELSPVFRDAIQLCKGVGCDYIWIDSLCIVQDDHADWMRQSQKMAQIYSNAHFNIAATLSPDSTHSLFQERWTFGDGEDDEARCPVLTHELEIPSGASLPVYARLSHRKDHGFIQNSNLMGRLGQAPLMGRAWVFQEVLLARRVLHVCASELIWECKTLYTCECGSIDSAFQPKATAPTPKESNNLTIGPLRGQEFALICDNLYSIQATHDFWLKIARQYSSLSLTRPSDRVAALAGLANAIQGVTNGKYLAGIWIDDLARSLLWDPVGGGALRSSDLPTWSWVSRYNPTDADSNMSYHFVLGYGFRQDPTTTIHTPIKPPLSSNAPDGIPHEVIFHGPVILATIVVKPDSSYPSFYIQITSDSSELSHSSSIRLWADCPKDPGELVQEGDMVECLLFGTDNDVNFQYVLVVRESEFRADGDLYYKRIGVSDFLYPQGPKDRFKNAEIKKIRII